MTRVRFRHVERGEITESDLIICHPDEWEGAPERSQNEWSSGTVDLSEELEALTLTTPALIFALKRGHLCQGEPAAFESV